MNNNHMFQLTKYRIDKAREEAKNQIIGAEDFIDTMEKYIDEYRIER